MGVDTGKDEAKPLHIRLSTCKIKNRGHSNSVLLSLSLLVVKFVLVRVADLSRVCPFCYMRIINLMYTYFFFFFLGFHVLNV